jgi:hypothetical protein
MIRKPQELLLESQFWPERTLRMDSEKPEEKMSEALSLKL